MIKIAHFGTRLEYGGVESVVLNYTSQFETGLIESHFVTQDVNVQECIDLFKKNGFIVHIVTHKRKSIVKNIIEIAKILKNERFDIVHAHMTTLNFYILFLAKLYGCKIRISHSHNNYIERSWIKRIINFFLSFLTRLSATDYFACGIDAAKFLYGEKNLHKTYIMKNAINDKLFKFDASVRQSMRIELGLESKMVIGHIGRFGEQKNHKFIVEICDELKKNHDNFIFLLIGTGDLVREIKNTIRSYNLENFFLFVGNTNEAYRYYQAMDVFILPSLFEGLPVVGIEAQYNGLKLLVSDQVDKRMALIEDNVKFLPIYNPCVWAKELSNIPASYDRSVVDKPLVDEGYNLAVEGKKLQDLYMSKIKLL